MKNGGFIFDEEKRLNFLTKKTRTKLIHLMYMYCIEKVSSTPTKEQMIEFCQAVIVLFPSLKENNSSLGGIVS